MTVIDTDQGRERVLGAAARVLGRRGYASTRIAHIAEAAGVQAPAIYRHFASRDELLGAVVIEGTARMREQVLRALNTAPREASALDRIDIAVEAHLRQLLAEPGFAPAVILNVNQMPTDIRARQAHEERALAAVWRTLFVEAEQEGLLRSGVDYKIVQMLVTGALNWSIGWYRESGSSIETLVAGAQTTIRRGITVGSARGAS